MAQMVDCEIFERAEAIKQTGKEFCISTPVGGKTERSICTVAKRREHGTRKGMESGAEKEG